MMLGYMLYTMVLGYMSVPTFMNMTDTDMVDSDTWTNGIWNSSKNQST